MFEDKEITCGCGNVFIWTAGEQEYYRDKGLQAPRSCPECRAKKKAEREQRGE
jgi:hypothetical protein